jgi:hypothetical protein
MTANTWHAVEHRTKNRLGYGSFLAARLNLLKVLKTQ